MPNDYQPVAPPSFPYLFSIGEFRAKKNFHTLVEMMPFLEDSLHLIIAGSPKEPYYTKVLEHIEKHQLKDRVHLLGKISELDKLYYYQNAEAFVFPSLREGFGIPPIEAMSFGIPIFLSDTTSLPEVGGENAFYWENFKPQYMAETLKKGLKQYATKPAWYATQYKNRANEFSWKTAAKSYIKIYRSILENET